MARKKVETAPTFTAWCDVDNAMQTIIECEGCIDEINAELNRKLAASKQEMDTKAKPLTERIKKLEYDIKDFVIRHRDEIDGKTKQLNFGKTGFRMSTSLVLPASRTDEIIANLKRYDMNDCINTKESVNKDVLKKYKSEDILKTGASLKSTDDFWYEVDKERLKPSEA
ncbi:MAG: host-nuclease inhibitor Gam family protein [Hydrogenoanaerobacterium sp.]